LSALFAPHEPPLLGLAGRDPLATSSPSSRASETGCAGGVTFEDLVLVTEAGCDLITRFPYDLTPRA